MIGRSQRQVQLGYLYRLELINFVLCGEKVISRSFFSISGILRGCTNASPAHQELHMTCQQPTLAFQGVRDYCIRRYCPSSAMGT